MALFTDGPPATIDDLRRYDSQAVGLARDAAIDLDAKLAVAAEEVGQEIFSFLLYRLPPQGTSENQLFSLSPSESAREGLGLSDVVVTPALRRWHAMRALAGLYRDAYSSDVTNRYAQKWAEYEKLSNHAADYCFTTGIGLSWNPVPQAPVAVVSQVGQPGERIACAIYLTWVNTAGQEGAPSEAWQAPLGPGDQLVFPGSAPAGIVGWNVYVGADTAPAVLQNSAPLSPSTAWTLPDSGLVQSGAGLPDGQKADYLVVDRRVLSRR